jgi:hypothetical protein
MNNINSNSYRHQFLKIVDELRSALGYSLRSEEEFEGEEIAMEMMYGGFDFSVVHSQTLEPNSILIECVFGPVPDSRAQIIMRRLLEMNAALAELDGSAFSFDQAKQSLIYTLRIELNQLDGVVLLRKMTETVWHGRRWLETRYMNSPDSSSNELMNPLQLA